MRAPLGEITVGEFLEALGVLERLVPVALLLVDVDEMTDRLALVRTDLEQLLEQAFRPVEES